MKVVGRIMHYLNKALWHAYAVAALVLFYSFAMDTVEWYQAMFKVSVMIAKAVRGGTT